MTEHRHEHRPDPEALLARVKAEEAREQSGHLMLFFGAAAGVGKTYAMLEAARALQGRRGRRRRRLHRDARAGGDGSAARGLEILPPRMVAYRGTTLQGVRPRRRARAPARGDPRRRARPHQCARAPGTPSGGRTSSSCSTPASTCTRRSTSSTSRASTTSWPRSPASSCARRCPTPCSSTPTRSSWWTSPPDELLQRLQEGKVYLPEQAQAAIQNFFREGQPDRAARAGPPAHGRARRRGDAGLHARPRRRRTWPVSERILVCVSPSPLSAQLVRAGRRLAHAPGRPVDRRLRRDARQRPPAPGRPRPRRPDAPARRAARRRDGHAVRRHDERGDPRLCARSERQQDRHRQARPVPLEADRARIDRGRRSSGAAARSTSTS